MRSRSRTAVELSPIKAVELAAARRPDVVSLAQGIPSFDTPEVIKAHVRERMAAGACGRYSLCPGLIELRELVADSLRAEGMRYDPDGEVLITAGAIEAISATLLALVEPGAEVILPSPCYASYQQVIRMAGCEPRFVALDEERNFDLDVDAIARLITPRTAALFYCNPNNPTGTIYSREQSLRMLELAERHDLYVITDEVYKDFLYTDEPHFTPAQQEAYRRRVVRIFSFSKAYAMTGWRVGYLHSAREVVTQILKVHDALVTCAPVISQHAAVAALLHGSEAISEFRRAYRRRRDITLRHLDELSHIFDYQKPNGAYFVFPRVKDTVPLAGDSQALAAQLLERAGVALVPGIAFGPTGEGHLRLSFSRDEADIEEAFARMRGYFARAARATRVAAPPRAATTTPREDARPTPPVRSLARGAATAYLQSLARLYLRRRRPRVVAIAGFRGKTVFKRVLTALLERGAVTRANPRSYNTEIGLPLAVLGLEINPKRLADVGKTLAAATTRALLDRRALDLLVLELGARQRGDMATLLRTVQPDWAIITSIAEQAQEQVGALAVAQDEIGELLSAVPAERLLVCADDELLADLLRERGIAGGERLLKQRLQADGDGYRFATAKRVYRLGGEIVGDSARYAVQAAILLGEQLGLPAAQIVDFLVEETGAGDVLPVAP